MISKTHLIDALTATIFNKSAVRADKLVALLTAKAHMNTIKNNVWGKNHSKINPGQIHGLVLMSIASYLLLLRLASKDLVGKKKIDTQIVEV